MKTERVTHPRLTAEILDLLSKGKKSVGILQERMRESVRELIIIPILQELKLAGLVEETERLPEQKVWEITEKGKKLIEEEKAKAEKTKLVLKEGQN